MEGEAFPATHAVGPEREEHPHGLARLDVQGVELCAGGVEVSRHASQLRFEEGLREKVGVDGASRFTADARDLVDQPLLQRRDPGDELRALEGAAERLRGVAVPARGGFEDDGPGEEDGGCPRLAPQRQAAPSGICDDGPAVERSRRIGLRKRRRRVGGPRRWRPRHFFPRSLPLTTREKFTRPASAFTWSTPEFFFRARIKQDLRPLSDRRLTSTAMPSAAARVRAAIDARHTIRELRTAKHTSLVMGGDAPAPGRPARGRPVGTLVLMRNGQLTPAGREYERQTGAQLYKPSTWVGEPYRVGNVQYIDVSGSGPRKISSWVRNREVVTKFGLRYYAENPRTYIINVPVKRVIRLADGRLHELRESTIPVEWHDAPQRGHVDFTRKLMAHVRERLPEHYTTQSVHEIRVLYDRPLRDWTIDEKTVRVEGGSADIDVELDMPLRAYDGRHSYGPMPEAVVNRAFERGVESCVLHQLSPHLGLSESRLEELFFQAA